MPGAWAIIASTVLGIMIIELGPKGAWFVEIARMLIAVVAATTYWLLTRLTFGGRLARLSDPRNDVQDPWRYHIECHVCNRSYSAIEMDRDPSHNQEAICTGCAEGNAAFLHAVKVESDGMVGQRSNLAT
ncbi:hypothetical protein D3C76_1492180 [compost metagenome]